MPPEKEYVLIVSEQVTLSPTLRGILAAAPNSSVLLEPLPDGTTKITVRGATFEQTLRYFQKQLSDSLVNARLEGYLEAEEEEGAG